MKPYKAWAVVDTKTQKICIDPNNGDYPAVQRSRKQAVKDCILMNTKMDHRLKDKKRYAIERALIISAK